MKNTNCKMVDEKLADLLLDPVAVPAEVRSHVAKCGNCRAEIQRFEATLQLLDTWEAPEPSPYFMTRLDARMREERQAAPAGWLAGFWSRLRAGIVYGSGLHVRPLAAMALSAVLLLGGGAYLGMTGVIEQPTQSTPLAATVHDLQTLDSNAQVLDTMDSLSNDNGD